MSVGAAHAALVTGGALVALLAVEALLRLCPALAGPRITPAEKIYFTRYDPELGWAPRPLVSGIHRDDGFSVFVSQNAWGLRAAADVGPVRRIAGRRRVLVLGDSYVWGYGVSQHELFTDPAVVGNSIDLVNFGVSGYGTDQELLFYRRLGTRFDVDEVALVFTPYNDVENNLEPEQYGYLKPYFTLAADGGLTLHREHLHESRADDAAEALLADSRALNLLIGGSLRVRNVLLRDFEEPLGAAEARDRVLGPGDVTARDRRGLALTMALIRTLHDEVRARGAAFSVVFVPYKPHIIAGAPENHPFVPLLASALSVARIPYYEPYGLFLAASRNGLALFNALDNHFSAAGHRLFARVFADPTVRAETRDLYDRRPVLASPPR
jgi:lysophospholipase L1-like esterase